MFRWTFSGIVQGMFTFARSGVQYVAMILQEPVGALLRCPEQVAHARVPGQIVEVSRAANTYKATFQCTTVMNVLWQPLTNISIGYTYIYIYIYVYIYIYIYTQMYTSIYKHISIYVHMYKYRYIHI